MHLDISFIGSRIITLFYSIQVTDVDLDNLKAFVDSLTVENGYPCSHRRMKLYVSEVGIDNFTRSDFKIFKSKNFKSAIILTLSLTMNYLGFMTSIASRLEMTGFYLIPHL